MQSQKSRNVTDVGENRPLRTLLYCISRGSRFVQYDYIQHSVAELRKISGGRYRGAESAETSTPCITWGPQRKWGKSPRFPVIRALTTIMCTRIVTSFDSYNE